MISTVMFPYSKHIVPLDDAWEMTGSAVRSYVTVERPSGGKQIRKAKQQSLGKWAAKQNEIKWKDRVIEHYSYLQAL